MRNRAVKWVWTAVMLIFSITFLYPLIWLAINSLKDTTEITSIRSFALPQTVKWVNYYNAVVQKNIVPYFLNSAVNTVCTILISVVCSTMMAYACTRMLWRGKGKLQVFISLGMLLPSQIVIAPVFIMLSRMHLDNTRIGIILTISAFNLALPTIIACSFLKSIPVEVEEAAIIDGAGVYGLFFRIMLPILKPAIANMSIYIFLNSWNEFIYALTLIRNNNLKTLPILFMTFSNEIFGTDYGGLFAAMILASIPPIVMYLFFSNKVEDALTAGSILK